MNIEILKTDRTRRLMALIMKHKERDTGGHLDGSLG